MTGGYTVSTACFAFLTRELRKLAGGNLVLALEGGYNLEVLKTATEQCLRALLNLPIEKITEQELARRPCAPAVETLQVEGYDTYSQKELFYITGFFFGANALGYTQLKCRKIQFFAF